MVNFSTKSICKAEELVYRSGYFTIYTITPTLVGSVKYFSHI